MALDIGSFKSARDFANVIITNTAVNGASNSQIAARNLEVYKNIFFPAPAAAADYYRITEAIDRGTSVAYRTAVGQRYTIPANILAK